MTRQKGEVAWDDLRPGDIAFVAPPEYASHVRVWSLKFQREQIGCLVLGEPVFVLGMTGMAPEGASNFTYAKIVCSVGVGYVPSRWLRMRKKDT